MVLFIAYEEQSRRRDEAVTDKVKAKIQTLFYYMTSGFGGWMAIKSQVTKALGTSCH